MGIKQQQSEEMKLHFEAQLDEAQKAEHKIQ